MENKQYISRIKLANDIIVDIKDLEARSNIEAIAALVEQQSTSISNLQEKDIELAALIQSNTNKFAALDKTVEDNIKAISTIQDALSALVQPKASKEISVATDGTLGINEMNVNKLVQTESDVFIINGGSAV